MKKAAPKNIKLGVFVLGGLLCLIYALYMIGNSRDLFGSTIRIYSAFNNVNGLMKGNNVRFAGIDIGSVDKIKIINDSTVLVTMILESDAQKYIKDNAISSVGTDGLMGNKIVNIEPLSATLDQANPNLHPAFIKNGDTLQAQKRSQTDQILSSLNHTSSNVEAITENLKIMTTRINSHNSLWSILMDTAVAENVKQAIVNIRMTGANSAVITGELGNIAKDIKNGKGSVGALLTDTSLSVNVKQTIIKIDSISNNAAVISGDLSQLVSKTGSKNGLVGKLLMDTTVVPNLDKTMKNLNKSSADMDEDLVGLRHSWPLRHYFKKQARLQQQRKADSAAASKNGR